MDGLVDSPLNGYYPETLAEDVADHMRRTEPEKYVNISLDTMAHHVNLMLELQKRGAITFDYGNNLRGQAKDQRSGILLCCIEEKRIV